MMRWRRRAPASQSQIEVEVRARRWHQLSLEMREDSACPMRRRQLSMMLHHVLCGPEVVMSACCPKQTFAISVISPLSATCPRAGYLPSLRRLASARTSSMKT